MRANVNGRVLADSNDVVACAGYHYFPRRDVRVEWLEKTPKTDADLKCPHGVQFYDVVVAGKRYARAAWMYEAPRPVMEKTADRFGFWNEIEVG